MQQETYTKSKRIASNTIFLFLRMFVLTIVNLYAVRLLLKGLGEEDYGIFNTVAGVVLFTSFINNTLALSIQRFISFSLGERNPDKARKIFSASLNIIGVMSLLLIIFLETIGVWFLNTQLVIPAERLVAAQWAFQFVIVCFICSIVQIPFMASMFAHEDMGRYATISTVECFLKLLAAFLIGIYAIDNLIGYSFFLLIVSIVVLALYACISRFKYADCHYEKIKDKSLYKELLSFSGWTLLGPIANIGTTQGNILLLNLFYGPLVIASFAIAMQINNAFSNLCNSVVLAFRPAMTKAYAENDFKYLNQLFSVSNKSTTYIILIAALPIIAEMRTILGIWLDNCSEMTILFSRLIIIYILFFSIHNPITIVLEAAGHVKEYHLPIETIMLLCFPCSWLLLRMGFPPYSVIIGMIGICITAHIVRLWLFHKYYGLFPVREYVLSYIVPTVIICTISTIVILILHQFINAEFIRLVAVFLFIPLIIVLFSYLFGINQQERDIVRKILVSPLQKRQHGNRDN